MNALSSFCRDTPVYCATTIDLNPVDLDPSHNIPQIPNTDLIEQLKTYGDAESTVSISAINVADAVSSKVYVCDVVAAVRVFSHSIVVAFSTLVTNTVPFTPLPKPLPSEVSVTFRLIRDTICPLNRP